MIDIVFLLLPLRLIAWQRLCSRRIAYQVGQPAPAVVGSGFLSGEADRDTFSRGRPNTLNDNNLRSTVYQGRGGVQTHLSALLSVERRRVMLDFTGFSDAATRFAPPPARSSPRSHPAGRCGARFDLRLYTRSGPGRGQPTTHDRPPWPAPPHYVLGTAFRTPVMRCQDQVAPIDWPCEDRFQSGCLQVTG